jgi:thiamine-monophosphate kinase
LEGVHFRRDWQSPECIGHRCLARGLSDIAAMGGEPIAVFLSLAVPRDLPQKWVDRFFSGFSALARRYKAELAGGDTAQSPGGVLADVIVFGSVPRGKALLRPGARPGDRIYVTGSLGKSAALLEQLRAGAIKRGDLFPEPRIRIGKWLRERRIASACIDISDGLSTDLFHICEESGVGAVISADAIPVYKSKKRKSMESRPLSADNHALDRALHGGEDYELLFTAPRSKDVPKRIAGVEIARIGEIVRGKPKMEIIVENKKRDLIPAGWEHFS